MKIRSLVELQDGLDREFSWRLKEISQLKKGPKKVTAMAEKTLIRAGVALLYAHWEGFIQASAKIYASYVFRQRVSLVELIPCFASMALKSSLASMTREGQSALQIAAFEDILNSLGAPSKTDFSNQISAKSNLNSSVFSTIATLLGIDVRWYEPKFNLIDESLLSRRNKIAHGEYIDIEYEPFGELADTVILLMRTFKTDIENAAYSKSFLK